MRGVLGAKSGWRRQLSRYLIVGGGSVVLDVGTLALLHGVAGLPLWLSTSLAFGLAFGWTFTGNLRWTFGASGLLGRRMVRYSVLVGVNYVLTLVIVLVATRLGLYYLASKGLAVLLVATVNFVAYRRWVFA